jgi:hypothetical protein
VKIVKYTDDWHEATENFRNQALSEGNDALISAKFQPGTTAGHLLLCVIDNKVMSISLAEPSHYTGEPNTVCRICRYHILRKYRSNFLFCGFKMLRLHCEWADQNGYKIVYWTHNRDNIALNKLYQKKRKYAFGVDNNWFLSKPFNEFILAENIFFKASPNANTLQYIYYRKSDPDFNWEPTQSIVRLNLTTPL